MRIARFFPNTPSREAARDPQALPLPAPRKRLYKRQLRYTLNEPNVIFWGCGGRKRFDSRVSSPASVLLYRSLPFYLTRSTDTKYWRGVFGTVCERQRRIQHIPTGSVNLNLCADRSRQLFAANAGPGQRHRPQPTPMAVPYRPARVRGPGYRAALSVPPRASRARLRSVAMARA